LYDYCNSKGRNPEFEIWQQCNWTLC
jgi:hypothetical protein